MEWPNCRDIHLPPFLLGHFGPNIRVGLAWKSLRNCRTDMILWWTYQQLRASSPKTRLAVIAKLVESDGLDSIEPLQFALKDKEPEVRIAAVEALGKITDTRVMQPLLLQLRDPSAEVRAVVADILGQRGDFQAIGALTAMLR